MATIAPKRRMGTSNTWMTSSGIPEGSGGSRGKFVPTPEMIRKWAKASTTGGRFMCPKCREQFSVTYGIFGHSKPFSESEFWCRQCASEEVGFSKSK